MDEVSQLTKTEFGKSVLEARNVTKQAQKEYFKEHLEDPLPIGGDVEKKVKAVLGKKVVKELDTNFLRMHKELKKSGRFPEWVPQLVELDANPIQLYTDSEFAQLNEAEEPLINYVRKNYPNYAVLVALKRKTYLADLGNHCMRILARRAVFCPKSLQIALEIAGIYTPKIQVDEDTIPESVKKQRIKTMLEEMKNGDKSLD